MQEYFDIQKDVLLLKDTLCDIKSKISTNALIFNSVDDLTRDIDFYSVSINNYKTESKITLNDFIVKFNHICTNSN